MDEVAEVQALWNAAVDASNSGNTDAQFERMSDDILLFSAAAGGFVDGLATVKANQEQLTGQFEHVTFTTSDVRGRVVGDTAILWGDFEYRLQPKDGEPVLMQGRFTSTWAKVDGRWIDVLNHYT